MKICNWCGKSRQSVDYTGICGPCFWYLSNIKVSPDTHRMLLIGAFRTTDQLPG